MTCGIDTMIESHWQSRALILLSECCLRTRVNNILKYLLWVTPWSLVTARTEHHTCSVHFDCLFTTLDTLAYFNCYNLLMFRLCSVSLSVNLLLYYSGIWWGAAGHEGIFQLVLLVHQHWISDSLWCVWICPTGAQLLLGICSTTQYPPCCCRCFCVWYVWLIITHV